MKQTAVEWLVDYIENQNKNGYEFHPKYNEHIVQQAKEMEKEEAIEFFIEGYRQRAIASNLIFDNASRMYAIHLFEQLENNNNPVL